MGILPGVDKVVLRGKNSSSKCMIPWDENALFSIEQIIERDAIEVSGDKYEDQILNCYEENIRYSIFPENRYSVTLSDQKGSRFAGRASEYSESALVTSQKPSFSDNFLSVWIQRSNDKVTTGKEVAMFLRVKPGVPFAGFSSNDVMEKIVDPSKAKIFMFSTLTRRFIEFDIVNGRIVRVYKCQIE